jgi:hypothetical protein
LNLAAIFEFFTLERVLGTKTFYKDISLLPPATLLHYRDGNISFSPYWELEYREEAFTQGSWPNFVELIRHNEKLKRLTIDTLGDSVCLDPSIFNIQRIEDMFKGYLDGKDKYMIFFHLLLTFGRWHKKYGPRNLDGIANSKQERKTCKTAMS